MHLKSTNLIKKRTPNIVAVAQLSFFKNKLQKV